jgi:hypothetical protein
MAPIIGWTIAVFAHSVHNTISTLFQGFQSLAIGLVFDWSGWIAMILFIVWALYREQLWIKAHLRDEVTNGVITPDQYRIASSTWAQASARIRALFAGKYHLTDRFYLLTAELAFKKHQASTLGEQEQAGPEIERVRAELEQISPEISV